MKIFTLVIFLFLICQNSFCQEKTLCIKNRVTNKEIIIKENKRIKVLAKNGKKFAGRFMVLDQNSIAINGEILNLNEIEIIRKHSLFYIIIIKANFFHMGTVAFLVSLIPGGLPLMLVGAAHLAGGIYSGIKFPNLSESYTPENNWVFKINGMSDSSTTKS